MFPGEPSASPSFVSTPENDSGVNGDSKHNVDDTGSPGMEGEKSDSDLGELTGSLSPTAVPVDREAAGTDNILSPSVSKSPGEVIGNRAPALGVPVEPTPAPIDPSSNNGVIDAIGRAFEMLIGRIRGGRVPWISA